MGIKTKEKKKAEKVKRKQIGVQIDEILWRKFRARCLEDGIAAGAQIEKMIENHLKKFC